MVGAASVAWTPVAEYESMEACKKSILGGELVFEDEKALRFNWASSPGNGKTRAYFVCASHVQCPVHVRAVLKGATFVVECRSGVKHASEPELRRRKNSAMTVDQEESIKKSMQQGVCPAAMLSMLTLDVLSQHKAAGSRAEKRTAGGLAGACIHAVHV